MKISLRPTQEVDAVFVVQAETDVENRAFVTQQSFDQHLEAIKNPDITHLIIELEPEMKKVGFMIFAGRENTNNSIELRRIIVTEKGKGIGRQAIQNAKRLAFEQWSAHRLWLDVKTHNSRARSLYESEGFVAEGILRECVKTQESWESLVIMSMLRTEYQA